MARVLVLNGPNLNRLGRRRPELYGRTTLAEIEARLQQLGRQLDLEVELRQSNHEGELVAWIHEACERFDGLLINAAAYTHTSIAIMDALEMFPGPVVEVHLSNIFAREPFRHRSFVSPVATGVVCGFGPLSYELALRAVAARLGLDGSGDG